MDAIEDYLAKADEWAKRALTARSETDRADCRAVEQSYRALAEALRRKLALEVSQSDQID